MTLYTPSRVITHTYLEGLKDLTAHDLDGREGEEAQAGVCRETEGRGHGCQPRGRPQERGLMGESVCVFACV